MNILRIFSIYKVVSDFMHRVYETTNTQPYHHIKLDNDKSNHIHTETDTHTHTNNHWIGFSQQHLYIHIMLVTVCMYLIVCYVHCWAKIDSNSHIILISSDLKNISSTDSCVLLEYMHIVYGFYLSFYFIHVRYIDHLVMLCKRVIKDARFDCFDSEEFVLIRVFLFLSVDDSSRWNKIDHHNTDTLTITHWCSCCCCHVASMSMFRRKFVYIWVNSYAINSRNLFCSWWHSDFCVSLELRLYSLDHSTAYWKYGIFRLENSHIGWTGLVATKLPRYIKSAYINSIDIIKSS